MKQFTERSPLLSPQRKITAAQEEAWLEDAVTIGLRRLCNSWTWSCVMWYLSFVMQECEILFQSFVHISNIAKISVVFIPMWVGSIGGIIMISMGTRHLCGCHKNLRVISKEHQAYLHHMGRDTHGMIAFESLPLLRLYYLWSILSVVSMVCLVVTQALWYVWLVDGAIGMWQACVPVGILCLGGVLYVTLCKSVSASTGVCILLAFSWLILVTVKLQSPADLFWSTVVTPLIMLQVGLGLKLFSLCWGLWSGTVQVMHKMQWVIWWLYFCAWIFSIQSVWLTLHLPTKYDIFSPYTAGSTLTSAHPVVTCWFLIITLLMLGLVATFHFECQTLTRSKGYSLPIPLVKNAIGTYEPRATFFQQEFSVIGTITNTHRCPQHMSFMGVQQQQTHHATGGRNSSGSPLCLVEPCDSNMKYSDDSL